LFNLLRKAKSLPKVWFSASVIGYYKNSSHPALEETETFKADALGIRTVALRLGIVLGHDSGITSKMLPLIEAP
jgi:NAD dependent epimerase/dehydratase family enzyme